MSLISKSDEDQRAIPSFRRQFFWLSTGRISAAGMQAVLLMVAARLVAPSEFGLLSVVVGVATVVQTAGEFGLATYIARERARDPDSAGIATALRFNAVTTFGLALFIALLICGAGLLISPTYYLMLPLCIWASSERNTEAWLQLCVADGDIWHNVVNLNVRRLSAIALLLAFVAISIEPLLAYSLGVAIAAIGAQLWVRKSLKRRVDFSHIGKFRAVLSESRHYWAVSVGAQVRNLDVVVVASIAGATASGFYAAASRITSPLRIIPGSFSGLLLPRAVREWQRNHSFVNLRRPLILTIIGLTGMYILIGILIPFAVPLLLGREYDGAILSMQIVAFGLPFAAGVTIVTSLFQAAGQRQTMARITWVFTIGLFPVLWLGAEIAGAEGAALGLGVINLVQLSTTGVILVRRKWALTSQETVS